MAAKKGEVGDILSSDSAFNDGIIKFSLTIYGAWLSYVLYYGMNYYIPEIFIETSYGYFNISMFWTNFIINFVLITIFFVLITSISTLFILSKISKDSKNLLIDKNFSKNYYLYPFIAHFTLSFTIGFLILFDVGQNINYEEPKIKLVKFLFLSILALIPLWIVIFNLKINDEKKDYIRKDDKGNRFYSLKGILNWITHYIESSSKRLKIDRLKNIKDIHFNRNHIFLLLSILIIFFGLSIIYEANQEQKRSNFMVIFPKASEEGSIVQLDKNYSKKTPLIQTFYNQTFDSTKLRASSESPFKKISDFNSSVTKDLPEYIPDRITLLIDYKEPVMLGESINIKEICITGNSNASSNQIYDVLLQLLGLNSSISTNYYDLLQSKNVTIDHISFASNMEDDEFYFPEKSYVTRAAATFCEHYNDKQIYFNEPNSKGEFEFIYWLNIKNESNITYFKGKVNLIFPIKSADKIEETNIRINKRILNLTGWLLILGSFPFSLALKQLLNKSP